MSLVLPLDAATDGSTWIVVARHGRTSFNVERRFRGRADPPLDATGREQAGLLGVSIAALRPAAVYASPRRRAQETAAEIGNASGRSVLRLEALDDIDYGHWTGRTAEEVSATHPTEYDAWLKAPERLRMPAGESVTEVQSRLWTTMLELLDRHPRELIVIVTHDIAIRLLACSVLEAPLRAIHAIRVDVASTSALEHRGGAPKLAWLNATSHLASLTPPEGGAG